MLHIDKIRAEIYRSDSFPLNTRVRIITFKVEKCHKKGDPKVSLLRQITHQHLLDRCKNTGLFGYRENIGDNLIKDSEFDHIVFVL